MKQWEVIRDKIIEAKGRFRSNDNISKFISEFDFVCLENELIDKFKELLEHLVIDLDDPNIRSTPKRLAKMFLHEILAGRYYPKPFITDFPNDEDFAYDGMLVVRAEIISLCQHHFQNMWGTSYIGILPNGKVLGLSKYIRIAQWCARRGQIQEKLVSQIAHEIIKATDCKDVAVHLSLKHACVEHRGVKAHSSLTQTTVLHGKFQEDHVKEEFFNNVHLQEKATDAR